MKVKTIKRIFLSIMTGVMVLSNAGTMLSFANNHNDSYYSAYGGDGGDYLTDIREKTDRSSAYAKNLNTNLTHRIRVFGTNSGYNLNGDCTLGYGYYDVKPNSFAYMLNSVYERGYRKAYLVFTEAYHKSGWIRGLWSPDSI